MARKLRVMIAAAMLAGACALPAADRAFGAAAKPTGPKHFYIISVEGEVNGNMIASLKRRTREALRAGADVIIYDVDTFGGLSDAALEGVEFFLSVTDEYPKVEFISYVDKQAASAGTFLVLSTEALYMSESAAIGDCQPIFYTTEGYKKAGEKMETFLRGKFRAVARKRGYPVAIVEGMISEDIDVYEITIKRKDISEIEYVTGDQLKNEKKYPPGTYTPDVIVTKGKLVTLEGTDAERYGFAKALVPSVERLVKHLGGNPAAAVRLKPSVKEQVVSTLFLLSPLLVIVGAGALFIEFKTPGIGVPAGIAALCLGSSSSDR